MKDGRYVIGVDFGSDSARAVLVDAFEGETLDEASMAYPRWEQRQYCCEETAQYRQHPKDYLEVLEVILREVLKNLSAKELSKVAGIAVDTTGSTVCPVDKQGVPLSMMEKFKDEPDAMFHLWKDHTAVREAAEMDRGLSSGETDYTQFQGKYSAEWFWAKILHTSRKNRRIKESAYTWIEHCDWIAGVLAGRTTPGELIRCSCGAGHKALWNSAFDGLPDRECLMKIDPYLGNIYDTYSQIPQKAGTMIGTLCEEWRRKTGLSEKVCVSVGSFDAHAGAVGVGISEHMLVKVVGTSTVDMLIVPDKEAIGKKLNDFCGMAQDSIVPGYWGCESGQSAFGDTYAWYRKILMWPLEHMNIPKTILPQSIKEDLKDYLERNLICSLEEAAEADNDVGITALDWLNGRRYPYLNETVKSAVAGLTLGTEAPDIYQAFVRATIFGSKQIYDSLIDSGILIDRVVCVGGVASKSRYIMQMMADVLGIPIMVSAEKQSCARGAGIFAAVGAGLFTSVQEAQQAMCAPYKPDFFPRAEFHDWYMKEYQKYIELGEYMEKGRERRTYVTRKN